MEFKHYSVLRDETIENLNIRPDGIYVDGTLGGAGHSYEIAKRLSDKGRLIGIDQDADAIKAAGERLLAVIEKSRGMSNKDMAKFADQINSLCDKWLK